MIEGAGLTVVTWNAQGSRGPNIAVAAGALLEFGPDLVLLQEIQRRQLGALRVAMQMVDARWRFKHWAVTVPAEGLGVLSCVPLADVHTQVLAHRWQFWNWRRRIALHLSVRIGDRTLRVVDVHLGAGVTTEERIRQVGALLDRARGAALIAGDLNARPDSAELARFEARGWVIAERSVASADPDAAAAAAAPDAAADVTLAATNWRPGSRTSPPTQRLDYVLVQRNALEAADASVPEDWKCWAELSDHVPVVARVTVGPQ